MKRSHLILWLPCILYYAFITLISAIPGSTWSGVIQQPFTHFDKVVHFFLYAFLGMVLARALSWEEYYHHLKKRWYLYFAFLIPLVALIDEVHQFFVPNRSMHFIDWLADISGALCGGLFYIFVIRGGRRRDRKISELEFIDVWGMGFLLSLFYFIILVTVNLFDYKQGFLRNYSHFSYIFTLIEYGLLGLLTIRYIYLKHDKSFFHLKDWLFLVLFGIIFISLYQGLFWILKAQIATSREIIWSLISFILGSLFYYYDSQIGKFRKKIWDDPVYKRKTWQRVYFFLPPLICIFFISYLSTQSPQDFYEMKIPLPSQIFPDSGVWSIFMNDYVLDAILFFILGLFYFRAIAWESWWYERRHRIWIWIGATLVFLLYAVFDEVLQYYIPGRAGDIYGVLTNIIGGALAFLVYFFGFYVVSGKFFSGKRKNCEFKV